jgi:hypothetical protein
MISMGFLITTPSKQALFLAFHIAQQIAKTPQKWNFFPSGSQ